MADLFTELENQNKQIPLAEAIRPKTLEEFLGQSNVISPNSPLLNLLQTNRLFSMIFWGTPGCGKTTLARLIATKTEANFIEISAVTSGVKDIKEAVENAKMALRNGTKTILFIDEIHRFNKAQQDAFLPYVEKGSITLIGATTENPSFELNAALLSRARVFALKSLSDEDLTLLLKKAINEDAELGKKNLEIEDGVLELIASLSKGDARTALNTLELAVANAPEEEGVVKLTKDGLRQSMSRKSLLYDKGGEEHFQVMSAFHKSMRNSDVNAALFWLSRMLEAGEDPLWVARRITRAAAEDVGLADPNALNVAVNAFQATKLIGMPECSVHLAEATIYICLAPKSNSAYLAYEGAKADAVKHDDLPIPMAIRSAYTKVQRDIGYGKGYSYAHDSSEKLTPMQCLPEEIKDSVYYHPTNQGVESRIGKRYEDIENWKRQMRESETN